MIANVKDIEAGDIVRPGMSYNQVVTHVTRDGKGRYVLRMEVEVHYAEDAIIELVRKVGHEYP